jgi:hypothetical protein
MLQDRGAALAGVGLQVTWSPEKKPFTGSVVRSEVEGAACKQPSLKEALMYVKDIQVDALLVLQEI